MAPLDPAFGVLERTDSHDRLASGVFRPISPVGSAVVPNPFGRYLKGQVEKTYTMVTTGKAPDAGETRRYLVECDGCEFERTVEGRDGVTRVGNAHRRETGHELVAVELPRSVGSS